MATQGVWGFAFMACALGPEGESQMMRRPLGSFAVGMYITSSGTALCGYPACLGGAPHCWSL